MAEQGAVARRNGPAQHVAAAAPAWLDRRLDGHVKAHAGIKVRKLGTNGESRSRNRSQPAPRGIARLKYLLDQLARHRVAVGIDAATVGVVDRGLPLNNHLDQHADTLQDVDRLKSRYHAWSLKLVDQKAKGGQARDGGDVARQDKAVDGGLGVVGDGAQRRRRGLVGAIDREVQKPARLGLQDGGGDGGRRSLKAHAHKNDRAIRVLLGNVERVERGVDDANVTPCRFLRSERGG